MKYANLHNKSTYSTGLAIGSCSDILDRAEAIGLHSVALTDMCTMSGVLDFYRAAKKRKFSACIGSEIYYFDDLEDSSIAIQLVLLAKNQNGYKNLCKLTTISNRSDRRGDGHPKLSIEDINEYSKDLVCLTGDIRGPFGNAFKRKVENSKAVSLGIKRVEKLQSIFEDDLYAEIVLNIELVDEIDIQKVVNRNILFYAPTIGLSSIISSDSYLQIKDQKVLQDIVISNSYGEILSEPRCMMSREELEHKIIETHSYIYNECFSELCVNSIKAAEKCNNIDLNFKSQIVSYPHVLHPLHKAEATKSDLLWEIARSNNRVDFNNPEYLERFKYEFNTITNNGKINLIDYFLVLEDLCRFCRDSGIVVGPGRGSGAGSLINFALRITDLDPIKYGLLFERFISEGRIQKGTLPDVDLDFSDQEGVRNYLIEKYGEDRVKSIGVMQTIRLKNAIKDAFKFLEPEIEFQQVNAITMSLPKQEQEEEELEYFERSIKDCDKFRDSMNKYPKVMSAISKLVGFNRQPGIHPCGLAISQDPLDDFVPLRLLKDKWVLEYNAEDCAFSGIIKYDALALTTLKYFSTCKKLIDSRHNISLDIQNIPLNDKRVFDAFKSGDTESVFQFNSEVSKAILTKIDVSSIDDLSLVTSVGRPGPMVNGQHFEFIKRKNGQSEAIAPHPALSGVLKDSYGIMIYQEGVMKASQILGGFSLAEADDIRKAMGKKEAKYLNPYKERFIQNFIKNFEGISEERASEIWHLMETFSGYGFNKSHSMSYALIGYVCQFFKTHFPLEWWTACMTHASSTEHLIKYFNAASRHVSLPDVNFSQNEFSIENNKIQMPLTSIKGIGDAASKEIYAKRPFSSFEDFFGRVNRTRVNKKVVTQLIFSDAFHNIEKSKNYQQLIEEYYRFREEDVPEEYKTLTRAQIANLKYGALEFMIPNYYEIYAEEFIDSKKVKFSSFTKDSDTLQIVGGILTDIKLVEIKKEGSKNKGKHMRRLTLSNCGESIETVIWPQEYEGYKNDIVEGHVYKIRGEISFYNGTKLQIKCGNIKNLTKHYKEI